ncbi:hypothetical protein OTU49_012651 [Cherax quadricarinatus]|uniref:RRM domain-containing protein n=1 Tax=Cherax quadricarinatus TaxID=27406 RepID=A0AAW0VZE1_CHEQU
MGGVLSSFFQSGSALLASGNHRTVSETTKKNIRIVFDALRANPRVTVQRLEGLLSTIPKLHGRQVSSWWAPNSWPLLGIIFRLYQASKDVEELEILLKEMKESCQDNSSSQVMVVLLWVVGTVLGVLYYIWRFFRSRLLKPLTLNSTSNTVVSGELVPPTTDDAGTSTPLPNPNTLPNPITIPKPITMPKPITVPIPTGYGVFIANVPALCSYRTVKQLLQKSGGLIKFMMPRRVRGHRGYGFATFENKDYERRALMLSGHVLTGPNGETPQKIEVNPADKQIFHNNAKPQVKPPVQNAQQHGKPQILGNKKSVLKHYNTKGYWVV